MDEEKSSFIMPVEKEQRLYIYLSAFICAQKINSQRYRGEPTEGNWMQLHYWFVFNERWHCHACPTMLLTAITDTAGEFAERVGLVDGKGNTFSV